MVVLVVMVCTVTLMSILFVSFARSNRRQVSGILFVSLGLGGALGGLLYYLGLVVSDALSCIR